MVILMTNMDGNNYVGEIGSVLAHGHNSAGIFRGLKSDSWEAGHREPFFARWPGVIPKASTSDALISLTDMFSTLASIVGWACSTRMTWCRCRYGGTTKSLKPTQSIKRL